MLWGCFIALTGPLLQCLIYFNFIFGPLSFFVPMFLVGLGQGLIVPNIKSANKMSIREISDEIARLADLSKSRKIRVDDLKGSTFTISSLGSFGGKFFTPIINPPEVAILGISKSYDSVLLKGSKPVSTTNLPISLSYDHRIINGVEGVKFTTRFCEILSDVNYFEENF